MSKKLLINELKYMNYLNEFMSEDITESFLVDELEDIQEENPIKKIKRKDVYDDENVGRGNLWKAKKDRSKAHRPLTKDQHDAEVSGELRSKSKWNKKLNPKMTSKKNKPSKAPSIPRRGR